MPEKSEPTQEQVALLEAAFTQQKELAALNASIKEASAHVPDLKVKIEGLLGIPTVEQVRAMEDEEDKKRKEAREVKEGNEVKETTGSKKGTRLDMQAIYEEMNLDKMDRWIPFHNSYEVRDASGDNSVKVEVMKGAGRERGTDYENNNLTVVIPDLGLKLILPDRSKNTATIESTQRESEPFTMHTPIGSPTRSWPKWSRDMTMEDYGKFDALLDRLAQPDVIKKQVSRPERRLR